MKIFAIGAGVTGQAVAEVMPGRGHDVTVFDSNPAAGAKLPEGVAFVTHEDAAELGRMVVEGAPNLVVASPGIAPSSPLLAPALESLEVVSEPELAWRVQAEDGGTQPWLCITGTNGKTTTTQMSAAILAAAGVRAPAVGNIGNSILKAVAAGEYDALAVELSSFQLFAVDSIAPAASVCLNLDGDHLDWHGSLEAYRDAKAQVYERTRRTCVYPLDDQVVTKMVEDAEVEEGVRAIGFTLGHPGPSDIGVVEDMVVDRAFAANRHKQADFVCYVSEIAGGGASPAIVKDALAATALTRAIGIPLEAVAKGLQDFRPAAHRREVFSDAAQVTWIDDSKATNAHAAAASLAGIKPGTAVWIVGGFAKGQNFVSLVEQVKQRLRGAIIIGEHREALKEAFAKVAPEVPTVEIDGHEDFMMSVAHEAVALSRPGDTVVLAPACASWDQFHTYAERGDAFRSAVERLPQ